MSRSVWRATTCNRDCPDACRIEAEVRDGRVVRLRGSRDHPVTRGFLCYRTSLFLERQNRPDRIVRPLLRRGDRQVEIPLDEALDLAAQRLRSIRDASGPAAIFHYRSGGSLGLLKHLADLMFEAFGPVTVKAGDICSGPGERAQEIDFGQAESHDVFDLLHSRHVIDWGKNLHVSNVHLIPIVSEARRRGADLVVVDPVRTRTAAWADVHIAPRPGGDLALALAVARRLFETGRVAPHPAVRAETLERFRRLAFSRTETDWLAEADVAPAAVEALAERLADPPAAILVGWGLQRRRRGCAAVRLLDALGAISDNLGRRGGGVSFYYGRRRPFDLGFIGRTSPPRTILEPLLGRQVLEARDPPIRALWITAANPVAMLPDARTVARAVEQTEFTVVVDAFPTDTTRRADLVLPATTLLEDDDLLGAYGHHWIGVARPVIDPPPGVVHELSLWQQLAGRLGVGDVLAGDARSFQRRMLAPLAESGVDLERLERGPVRHPLAAEVLYDDGRVATDDGAIRLIDELPEAGEPADPNEYPLWLMSNSTRDAQSSQWVREPAGPLEARLHPDAASGVDDGSCARLVSPLGSMRVRVVHDAELRRDVVVVPKGGHLDRGHAANALIAAVASDDGGGAAYQDTRVRLVPES